MAQPDENPRRLIDLDAAREARGSTRGDPVEVHFRGERFELPPELPARFLDLVGADDYEAALDRLGGDGFATRFLDDLNASYEDLVALAQGIAAAYGIEGDLGNFGASGASSSTTSSR